MCDTAPRPPAPGPSPVPQSDDMLNFSVAITVMKVQRKWRTRMRAAKLRRKKKWRDDRQDGPSYEAVFAGKNLILAGWVRGVVGGVVGGRA